MPVSRKRKPTMTVCADCHGKGGWNVPQPGTPDNPIAYRWHQCPECKGKGKVKIKDGK